MINTELLAPAGNIEAAKQAIHNGADAIYIGGKNFGARAFAGNFSYDEMKQTIDYAHLYGVKIYITVNTLIYQSEIKDFLKHVGTIYKLGADAVIMQDVGMIQIVRNQYPDMEIHASTQMHNHNDACLFFLQKLGIVRAVLARETTLEQIQSYTCDIEKEVFIHGALCISYSGQCLFSALTQNRSGNRGRCAQTCRMKYTLEDEDGNILNTEGNYLLSPKDLSLFEDIKKLIDADVTGFKIEGRMKSPQYVGHITKIYSNLIKEYQSSPNPHVEASDINDIKKLFNRGFTKGHLLEATGSSLMGISRPNHKGILIGKVISIGRDKIVLKLNDTLNQGDGIKFEKSDTGFICNKIYINGKLANSAKRGDIIELDAKVFVRSGESVLKTSDVMLLKSLQDYDEKKIAISAHVKAKKLEAMMLTFEDSSGNVVTVSGDAVQPSKTRPTTVEELSKSISKLGGTPFIIDDVKTDFDEDIFIAKSQVNALRRSAVDELIKARTSIANRKVHDYTSNPIKYLHDDTTSNLHVLVRSSEQFNAIKDIITGEIYTADENLYLKNKDTYNNLRLKTNKLAETALAYKNERLLVTDNGGVYEYRNDNDIILDYSLNALNAETVSTFVGMSAKRICLSPELELSQISDLITAYEQKNMQKPPLEAIIYARHELMAMKHCIISKSGKNTQKCNKCEKKQYYLTDINNNRFPIVTDNSCNNYILGQKIETSDVNSLKILGIKHFRVEFFNENAQQCQTIINNYLKKINN